MSPAHTESSPVGGRRLAVAFVGITAGLMIVALVLAFASWVFSGPLVVLLPMTTTLILAGTAVMNFISARMSSLPGSVLVPQDSSAAVLATTLSATVFTLADDARAGTALAIVAVSTLLTAVVMLILGWRRAGGLLRFVPVPVMGGFLGGTGWLLVSGAVDLARTGGGWTVPESVNVIAALLIGAVLTVAIRRGAGAKAFPIVVAGAVAAFYLVLALTPLSVAQARLDGFLPVVGPTVDLSGVSLGSVDWGVVVSALPRLLTIPVIATLALLMNVGGLELLARRDALLDRELITAGWGNLVGCALASHAGYPTLGISAVGFRIGIHSPAVPVLVGLVAAAAALVGPRLVSGLPVAVAAGLIAMVGIGFLMDWVVDAFRRLPRTEYVLMLAIIAAVALFGFVVGVGLGMAAAVMLFTIKYSRLNPIRHTLTGRERTSAIDRPSAEGRFLAKHGDEILVAELQGFLFFGTAHKAVSIVEERIKAEPLRFVIADLRRVEGFDSTAAYAFRRLAQIATDHSVALVYSDNTDALAEVLAGEEDAAGVTYLPELDRALEWCEDRILDGFERPGGTEWIIEGSMWERLEPWMDRISLDDGEVLADMGDDADCVFLVGEGRVAVELPAGTDRWRRVRSMRQGSMLGELALYSDGGRSARLSAEGPAVVYRLTPEVVSDLEANDPACAVAFHRSVASVIAERLKAANESVQALIR